MSVIAATGVVAPQISPAAVSGGGNVSALSQPQTASQSPTVSGGIDQPAVVVSLSSNAVAQAGSAPRSMDPDQVDDTLNLLSGANGFGFLYAHFDWAGIAAKFGDAIANRDQGLLQGGAISSASYALSAASGLGSSASDSVSPNAVQNGAAPGTITVAAFSFTSGGSTYSVTPGASGTLVGTKDGQAWKTWQLIPTGTPGNLPSAANSDSGAATALQTLTSLTTQAVSSGQQSNALDIIG